MECTVVLEAQSSSEIHLRQTCDEIAHKVLKSSPWARHLKPVLILVMLLSWNQSLPRFVSQVAQLRKNLVPHVRTISVATPGPCSAHLRRNRSRCSSSVLVT